MEYWEGFSETEKLGRKAFLKVMSQPEIDIILLGPGSTLKDCIIRDCADKTGLEFYEVKDMLEGGKISNLNAGKLGKCYGSKNFWVKRERQYRKYLKSKKLPQD